MTVPNNAIAVIESFCEEQTPPDFRDRMRIEPDVQGDSVTLAECRPPWDGGAGGMADLRSRIHERRSDRYGRRQHL